MNTGSSRKSAAVRRGFPAAIVVAAAITLTATGAQAATATHIHRALCTNTSLNINYNGTSIQCYVGTGNITVAIPRVSRVTTGNNTGSLTVTSGQSHSITHFKPHEIISFRLPGAEITHIDISSS
jgi:Beta/Gamma crystallin